MGYNSHLASSRGVSYLRLDQKEVLRLLNLLPVKHPEKVRMRDLMIQLKTLSAAEFEKRWRVLKNKIKDEIQVCKKEAEDLLRVRKFQAHPTGSGLGY